jgi:DNA-binding NtrC family response regulator
MKRGTLILIVDDDDSFREILAASLEKEGYGVLQARGGREALEILRSKGASLLVTDIKMPRMSGYDLIREARYLAPDLPVIAVTAYGSIRGAVEAMRLGASNYVPKPFDRRELAAVVRETLSAASKGKEGAAEGEEVSRSASMKLVLETAGKAAPSDATILLTGETGVGKEVVAGLIHRLSGRKVFVKVNCSAIPSGLLESELFGHRKGAFTGADSDRTGRFVQADGGTLLLDEIGDMETALQAKLLRALEEKQVDVVGGGTIAVDVRIIAATHESPERLTKEGRMREDLYYRLSVVRIDIPPLRERTEDIRPLAEHFFGAAAGGGSVEVDEAVFETLRRYAWPGNVRELRNLCERMVILRSSSKIGLEDVPRHVRGSSPGAAAPGEEKISLHEIEKQIIVEALEKNGWNQSKTARYLDIPRHVLLYRMEKFGIRKPG